MGFLENELVRYFKKFEKENFDVILSDKRYTIGEGEPSFTLHFHKLPEVEDLLQSTSLALGTSFVEGNLTVEGDFHDAVRMFVSQRDRFSLSRMMLKAERRKQRGQMREKRNVKSFYEKNEKLKELIYGEDFRNEECLYEDGQTEFVESMKRYREYVVELLGIRDGMSICELGWGGGSILARIAGEMDLTGRILTMSGKWKIKTRDLIWKNELDEKIQIEREHWSALAKDTRQYDVILCTGGLGYVEEARLPEFFRVMGKRLKEGGRFLLHTMNSPDQPYVDPWSSTYVRPGVFVPSMSDLLRDAQKAGLRVREVKDFTEHGIRSYDERLRMLEKNRLPILNAGGEETYRVWQLYLNGVRASYETGVMNKHLFLFETAAGVDGAGRESVETSEETPE